MLSSRFVRPFEWAELQLLLLERDRSGYSRWSDELLRELFCLNRALPEFSGVFTFVKIQTLLVLAFAEPNLPKQKLIIIDSIAALFRSQYQTTLADLKRRSEMFFNISGTLKGLANKFGLAVVVTNQVVDFIGPHDGVNRVRLGNLESLDTSGRRVSTALGLAWAHCINSRVFLARHEQSIEVDIRNAPLTSICSQTHRTFHLVFAPYLACASAEFVIRKEGIVGVSQ
ncbi:hypothetical protein L3X38_010073 [Prunus dulcis]|uniref:RecA family profile 1 domain-containing protein n=1 Tax=Prunus dulcis TaxID=3755 RepID=A0AAD4WEV7_PRUDU|nr:hypothetical protein L3X38_010073 [Prunus dulcis]